jgi:hypothetical protein
MRLALTKAVVRNLICSQNFHPPWESRAASGTLSRSNIGFPARVNNVSIWPNRHTPGLDVKILT